MLAPKAKVEACAVDSEALLRTIGDPFPRVAKPPPVPESRCRLAAVEAVVGAEGLAV